MGPRTIPDRFRRMVARREVAKAASRRPQRRQLTVVATDIHKDGGMERAHCEIILGLLSRGWKIRLISRTSVLSPHPNLSWHRVRTPSRPFVLAYPLFVLAATLRLAAHRRGVVNTIGALVLLPVDVVTIQFCHAGLRERGTVRRSQRTGLVYRISDQAGSRLSRGMERWAYRPARAGRFVAVSDGLSQEVTSAFRRSDDEVEVISNGVDTHVFRPDALVASEVRRELAIASDRLVAVFAGGDWERKGLGIAIDAVGRLSGWDLVVLGKGDVAANAARAAAAGARVYFVGHTPQPQRYYCAADAFVFPTMYEGFALVALEAAASGLPLLVTASSGANRLVRPGVNGWFVERTAESVAEHLSRLEDETLRARFAEAAIAAAAAFTWPRIVDGYERVLLEAAA